MNKKILKFATLFLALLVMLAAALFVSKIINQEEQSEINTPETEVSNTEIYKLLSSIINKGRSGERILEILGYSLSPDNNFALVKTYEDTFVIDLKNEKSILPRYSIIIDGFSDRDLVWVNENTLIVASSWSGYGAEGFPGIANINLKTGELKRVVEVTDCPDASYSVCRDLFSFEIKSISNGVLTYVEKFDSSPSGYKKEIKYERVKEVGI